MFYKVGFKERFIDYRYVFFSIGPNETFAQFENRIFFPEPLSK